MPYGIWPPTRKRHNSSGRGIGGVEDSTETPVAAKTTDGQSQAAALLAAGAIAGSYVVVQQLGAHGDRALYLARVAGDDAEDFARPHPREPHLLLLAAPSGGIEAIRALAELQLRHPRLLALRDFFAQD